MVVEIQPIGHAAEAAEPFQAADDVRLDGVARHLHLAQLGRRGAQRREFFLDGLLEFLRRVTGPRSRLDLEHGSQRERVLLCRNVLRNLPLVHELLVQTARSAAPENRGGDLGIGVAWRKRRRRQPRHVDTRQLHACGHRQPALRCNLRRRRRRSRHGRTTLQGREVLLHERLRLCRIDVSDDGEAGIVRRVVLAEELLHVLQLRGLDVLVRTDDVAVVGMALRVERLDQPLVGQTIRPVLDALPAFVADHVLLVGERRLVDFIEQVAHAIGLEPQRQLKLIGGHGLEVVGAVVIGGPVQIARSGGLEQPDVRVGRHVLRTLKHHVLEQVRKPGTPGRLVGRADVVPEIHRHHRQACLPAEDHL